MQQFLRCAARAHTAHTAHAAAATLAADASDGPTRANTTADAAIQHHPSDAGTRASPQE